MEKVDRGHFCPYCNLKVEEDPRKRLVRTVQPSAQVPGGKQLSHRTCVLSARTQSTLITYRWLLTERIGAAGGIDQYRSAIGGRRMGVLIGDLRSCLEMAHAHLLGSPALFRLVNEVSVQLADHLLTDELDLRLTPVKEAERTALGAR